MVSNQSGSDVRLIRHRLNESERVTAQAIIDGMSKGIRLGSANKIVIATPGLVAAVERVLTLLCRRQTAALFVLDSTEHLTAKQISALRRRQSVPSAYPKLRVGALSDTRPDPEPGPDGSPAPKPSVQCERFRIKTIAHYVVDIKPSTDKVKRKPILEALALGPAELAEAEAVAVALITARFARGDTDGQHDIPRSILFVLCDLLTVVARGSTAYLLVLDDDHVADAADPKALDKYTHSALTLSRPSPRTLYKQRVKAQRSDGIRALQQI